MVSPTQVKDEVSVNDDLCKLFQKFLLLNALDSSKMWEIYSAIGKYSLMLALHVTDRNQVDIHLL